MDIFGILNLFGGLAMFLYGMRLMGDGLKESSSGTLKIAMEHVTNSTFKAFLLGLAVTAIIQSSTATIVITSGLVAAGIITLKQSLGIIIGANVGTTVTGQIIRLLDIDSGAAGILQLFRPSTLAPVALIVGIVMIMGMKFNNSKTLGNIFIGFGILFTGLLNMTAAVNSLAETGIFERLFSSLGSNLLLGYVTGAGVAFILQSSSATIGILQALSSSGELVFRGIYTVIVGVYLGDCVTTAIVCAIGAKPEAKRVGIVNILFNFCKTLVVLIGVGLLHRLGALDNIWNATANPGFIADVNTIFNLGSALILFPVTSLLEKASYRIVKDEPAEVNPYAEKLEELNPNFYATPALALRSCYDVLLTTYQIARKNIDASLQLLRNYDEEKVEELRRDEDNIDLLTDSVTNYMTGLSANVQTDLHVQILNHYYKVVNEFERLGDQAMNIVGIAGTLEQRNVSFSKSAFEELSILEKLIGSILDCTETTFRFRDVEAATHIEPMEQVVDDMVYAMRESHMGRIYAGKCNVYAGSAFMDLLNDLERISDHCSNVGLATVSRVHPEVVNMNHDYAQFLHSGGDESYNNEYQAARKEYYEPLISLENREE